MLLDREAILKKKLDLPYEEVLVSEWGGRVRVRTLTAKELDDFQASNIDGTGKDRKPNMVNYRARFVVCCLVDDKGVKLFTEPDADELGQTSCKAIDRVFEVAQRLNGLTEQAGEELEKNSASATDGALLSA